MMKLTDYRSLGQSGLIVSPLALGTMTFGQNNWGATDDNSLNIFKAFNKAVTNPAFQE